MGQIMNEDSDLVAAAQRGDRDALDRLLRRHYDRIHAVCRRIAGSTRDADDAAQEALIRIVRAIDRFDGRASFSTWSYRIATNAALDELRRRGRQAELTREPAALAGVGVDEGTADSERRLAVSAALERLQPPERELIALKFFAGLENREIARVLGVSESNAGTKLHRAMTKLREACDGAE